MGTRRKSDIPIALKNPSKSLRLFIKNCNQSQILLCSHSSLMVGNTSLISVTLLRRDSGLAEHSQILFCLIYFREKWAEEKNLFIYQDWWEEAREMKAIFSPEFICTAQLHRLTIPSPEAVPSTSLIWATAVAGHRGTCVVCVCLFAPCCCMTSIKGHLSGG